MAVATDISAAYVERVGALHTAAARQIQEEIEYLQDCVKKEWPQAAAYLKLARRFSQSQQPLLAIETLRQAVVNCPRSAGLYRELISSLRHCGLTGEALMAAAEARDALPHDFSFVLKRHLFLPQLYDSGQEIDKYRDRFAHGLAECIELVDVNNPQMARGAVRGLGHFVHFYLGYQGRNDVALQRRFGSFVHQVVARTFPTLATPLEQPPVAPGTTLRIGYLSSCFYTHTVAKLFTGWLRERTRGRFEIFCYYIGKDRDATTEELRGLSDHFYQFPRGVAQVCRTIRGDRLHVLVFTDIGMDARTTQIAALRSAPIQCVTWGHPVTTGLPTIDYFISSALMEPPNAFEHYSEQLVLLPNIGVCYPKPVIPRPLLVKSRQDYGLREEGILYLSCQSVFKYLPQHDHIYARIARAVPNAQIVFLVANEVIAEKLLLRLARSFADSA